MRRREAPGGGSAAASQASPAPTLPPPSGRPAAGVPHSPVPDSSCRGGPGAEALGWPPRPWDQPSLVIQGPHRSPHTQPSPHNSHGTPQKKKPPSPTHAKGSTAAPPPPAHPATNSSPIGWLLAGSACPKGETEAQQLERAPCPLQPAAPGVFPQQIPPERETGLLSRHPPPKSQPERGKPWTWGSFEWSHASPGTES